MHFVGHVLAAGDTGAHSLSIRLVSAVALPHRWDRGTWRVCDFKGDFVPTGSGFARSKVHLGTSPVFLGGCMAKIFLAFVVLAVCMPLMVLGRAVTRVFMNVASIPARISTRLAMVPSRISARLDDADARCTAANVRLAALNARMEARMNAASARMDIVSERTAARMAAMQERMAARSAMMAERARRAAMRERGYDREYQGEPN